MVENNNEFAKEGDLWTNLATIRWQVCLSYNISSDELTSKSRKRKFAEARHMICLLIRELLPNTIIVHYNLTILRDRTTVYNCLKRGEDLIDTDPKYRKLYNQLKEEIITKLIGV